ncbi:Hypothetical predicted protein [Octopus vulgaris]|uniref:Uncharacterized protein n=1 Tax=Octopus vulgaris TaxID=6645 RepID=A0AA36AK62_OCTVU|nr:Hypothetical predicted protein [Octopus vulgaris]
MDKELEGRNRKFADVARELDDNVEIEMGKYKKLLILLVGLLESCFARSEILNEDTEDAGDAFSLEKRSEILYEDNLSGAEDASGAGDGLSIEKRSLASSASMSQCYGKRNCRRRGK